jgi:hypothetical protein
MPQADKHSNGLIVQLLSDRLTPKIPVSASSTLPT